MSYSPQEQETLYDERQKKLSRDLSICQKVQTTLESPGWQEILGPTLEKMILEVTGGKLGDSYINGKLDRARTDERREFYIGYKQALIDFYNRAHMHIRQLPIIEEQIKSLKKDFDRGTRVPMEDTRYNLEG
jgi:hypothetical protein